MTKPVNRTPQNIIDDVVYLREVCKMKPSQIRDLTGLPLGKIYNLYNRYGNFKAAELSHKETPESKFNFYPDNLEINHV